MDAAQRIEGSLEAALQRMSAPGVPPRLAAAIRYAVFPGGARVRPRLSLAVAAACGDDDPALANAAAVSVELLHCASLVHDDLPCFDDADLRRGKPTVHLAFGEPLAVLVGDALIVAAFEALAAVPGSSLERVSGLIATAARASGAPHGIVAGQAWECETSIDLSHYHRAKTGALFSAATAAGAQAAGHSPEPWLALGGHIGEAYQVADDIQDVLGKPEDLGKPWGQDQAHNRPSAVKQHGIKGAVERLEWLVRSAIDSIPRCPGDRELRALIAQQAERFVPLGIKRVAA